MTRAVKKKLKAIAENTKLVYDSGIEVGKADGGSDSFYDTFWDAYQNKGIRGNYEYAFSGEFGTEQISGWTDENFKPKYPIVPLRAQNMFNKSHIQKSPYLKNMDFSNCIAFTQCFNNSTIEELGVIDSGANATGFAFTGVFSGCKNLHTIEKWIPPRSSAALNYPFGACTALVNITVEGAIKQSISFGESSLLSKASITSIVNALSDTSSGMTLTLSLTAVNNAFGGGKDGAEWQALIATKPNWTFAYA